VAWRVSARRANGKVFFFASLPRLLVFSAALSPVDVRFKYFLIEFLMAALRMSNSSWSQRSLRAGKMSNFLGETFCAARRRTGEKKSFSWVRREVFLRPTFPSKGDKNLIKLSSETRAKFCSRSSCYQCKSSEEKVVVGGGKEQQAVKLMLWCCPQRRPRQIKWNSQFLLMQTQAPFDVLPEKVFLIIFPLRKRFLLSGKKTTTESETLAGVGESKSSGNVQHFDRFKLLMRPQLHIRFGDGAALLPVQP
jgi:hypothetical protein